MPKRQVIEIPGLGHVVNAIPYAVKIGPYLHSGSIDGTDPKTGKRSADVAQQIAQAFSNARLVMAAGGGSMDDIARVDVRVTDMDHLKLIDIEWVKIFPDKMDRPARNTQRSELTDGRLILITIIAYLT